jgi:hypothetical protein
MLFPLISFLTSLTVVADGLLAPENQIHIIIKVMVLVYVYGV